MLFSTIFIEEIQCNMAPLMVLQGTICQRFCPLFLSCSSYLLLLEMTLNQGSPHQLLEGQCPAEFSSSLVLHTCLKVSSKATTEGKPAILRQNKCNAATQGRRPEAVFLNGCQWRRGSTTLNKQLFRGNSLSFNESTAYLLIFNMFYIKQYFWI